MSSLASRDYKSFVTWYTRQYVKRLNMMTPLQPGANNSKTWCRRSAMLQSYPRSLSVILPLVLVIFKSVQSRELHASSSSSSSSGLPSEWITGIATNYGGPSEGKDPSNPSFGTQDVSPCTFVTSNSQWFRLLQICLQAFSFVRYGCCRPAAALLMTTQGVT